MGPTGTLPPQALLLCGALYGDRIGLDLALGVNAGVPARGHVSFDRLSPSLIWPSWAASISSREPWARH